MRDEIRRQARFADGLLHGAEGVERVGGHGAQLFARQSGFTWIDPVFWIGGGKSKFLDGAGEFDGAFGVGKLVEGLDAGAAFAQTL